MAPKYLIAGTPQREREAALLRRVEDAYDPQTRDVSALFIVPTTERADALRKAVVSHFGGRCWVPRVETPDTLLDSHADELSEPSRWIDTEARALLVRELARDSNVLGRRPVTRGLARKIVGFLDAIAGAWYEGGPNIEELTQATAPPSLAHQPGLAALAARYDSALGQRGLMDRRRLASLLLTVWRARGFPPRARMLVLDEFAFALPVHLRLFDVIAEAFETVVVTLPAPEDGISGAAESRGFAATAAMARWALDGADVETVAAPRPTAPQLVAADIFARDARAGVSLGGADAGDLRVVAFPSRLEEVRGVARMIRTDLGDITPDRADFTPYMVIVSSYGPYRHLVEETFREYGLPTNVARGAPLSATPLLRVVRKVLLTVAEADAVWTMSELMDVLRHARFDETEGALEEACAMMDGTYDPLDPGLAAVRPFWLARFERLVLRTGIADAFDATDWHVRLTRYLRHVRPDHDADDENAHFEEELRAPEVEVARDVCVIARFVRRVEALGATLSAQEFSEALIALLRDYGLIGPSDPSSDAAPGGDDQYEAWRAVEELLRQMVATCGALSAEGSALDAVDLAAYVCQALASDDSTRPPVMRANAVSILSPEQSMGLTHKRLYIVGLLEGEFPRAAPSNFLVDAEARSHSGDHARLDDAPVERFLFREALANAEHATLTYPRADGGRAMSPSPFLDDVCSVLGVSAEEAVGDPTEGGGALCSREALVLAAREDGDPDTEAPSLDHGNVAALIRMAAARDSVARWSEYDTYLPSTNARVSEQLVAFTDGELSATQFDTYAKCPAKLFYGHVLRIGAAETQEPDVAANVRGIVVHSILEKFFSQGGGGPNAGDWISAGSRARMEACARQVFGAYDGQYPNLYWEEEKRALVLGLDDADGPQGLLAGFLAAEEEERGVAFDGSYSRGRYNEVAFGSVDRKDARVRLAAHVIPRLDGEGDIRIKGYVDRVDVDEETGRFVVFDYKTGVAPRARDALDGMNFQLAIYMDALSGQKGLSRPAGGVFYAVQHPTKVSRREPLARRDFTRDIKRSPPGVLDEEAFERFREFTRDRVREVESHMRHGRFPVTSLTPEKAGCTTCDYRDICRVRPSRERRMDSDQPRYRPEPFEADAADAADGEAS